MPTLRQSTRRTECAMLLVHAELRPDITLQICQACDGEGRIYHAGWGATIRGGNLYWDDWSEPCAECEGTGGALIPCQPITEDEFYELHSS